MRIPITIPGLDIATNGKFNELEIKLFSAEKLTYYQQKTVEIQKLKDGSVKERKLSEVMTELISEALDFPLEKTRKFIPLVLQNSITEKIMEANTDINELEKVKDSKSFQGSTKVDRN
jgi:hypothetical protein